MKKVFDHATTLRLEAISEKLVSLNLLNKSSFVVSGINITKKNLNSEFDQLKITVSMCRQIVKYQRKILSRYNELMEGCVDLKRELNLINAENAMWRVDLKRERWIHNRKISVLTPEKKESI